MRVEIALVIIISMINSISSTTEVDNLNLLLPELQSSSYSLPLQLITAQGGCYAWTSSIPSALSVNPHDAKPSTCSKQALVQVVKAGSFLSSIYVTASDAATQSTLNIPVRIRKLHNIFIATKSRMMNLKEIQKIELFAHDSEQNTFTSLEGLRFVWTLEQKLQIIQTVPLANAQLYFPLKTRENIQKEGFQSDVLVVRALAPGNLKIIVRCIEPGYQHLTDSITLSVHQRFQLKPGPILHIVPSSSYQLFLQRPTLELISLPQSYYNIQSCPGFTINSTLYLTVANITSKCVIKVQDSRTVPPYSSSITVIVQNPVQIRIVSNPIIIVGEKSPYEVQLFNGNHERLYGWPKDLKIYSDFSIDPSNRIIIANSKKVGRIRASLFQLTSQLQITSLLPIQALLPTNYLHLPLEETFKLKMVGGSGLYDYSISNEVGAISSLGVLVCKQVGQAKITITDRSHPSNRATVLLKVSPLVSIRSLEQQKQVNKDQWGYFYIIGKNVDHQSFTQCLSSQFSLTVPSHKLQVDKKVNFTESIRFLSGHSSRLVRQALEPSSLLKGRAQEIIENFNIYVESREIEKAELRNYIYSLQNFGICQAIRFRSLTSLEDRALIKLTGSQTQAEVKVPLRVYQPITTTIKEDFVTFLLTPLSSLYWNYTGGSYLWPNSETKITINSERVSQQPQITCPNSEKISAAYELKLENQQTKFLLFPTSQKSQINVACKFPRKLQLSLLKGDFYNDIKINQNSQLKGSVVPVDQNGNQFYNSSNIQYQFTANTGIIEGKDTEFKYNGKEKSDRVKVFCKNTKQKLTFKRVEAQFDISVVEPIKIDHLLYDPVSQTPLKDEIKKYIQIITLFTPKKPYVFRLNNVTPLLHTKCNQSVSCERQNNKLLVNLLSTGRGFVSFKDKGVYGSIEWIYEFVIVEVDEVMVFGTRQYIPEGEAVNVTVNNIHNGKIISPLLYQDNYLQLGIDRNLKILEQSGNRFLVMANTAGRYEIHGQQGYPKTIRSKDPFVLNVYERIEPDISNSISKKQGHVQIIQGETTVVIGCRRILRVKGGPKAMQIIHQNQASLTVSPVSSNTFSIMGKKQGSYRLKLEVKKNEQIIALINLKVVVSKVESVQLFSIDEPVVGAQFRILPRFKVGQSEVEGCICDFEYKWNADKKIISLGASSSLGFLSGGGVNATALKQGSQIISLEVQDRISHRVIGQAQKQIKIITQIDLLLPTIIDRSYEHTETLRISPLTSYSFGKEYQISVPDDMLRINTQSNSIQATRKLGHSTVKIGRDGFRSELIEVEITYISGLFIGNNDGSLSLQLNSIQTVPIYLYDNHGKLFVTPLEGLELHIISSNPDVLKATISASQKEIVLEGLTLGISILTISLSGRNVYDSIAVSVGSLMLPSSQVRVLRHGVVKFTLPSATVGKWMSSDQKIAVINENSGEARALAVGKSKISNGNIFGWVSVVEISKIDQIDFIHGGRGEYTVVFRAMWNGKHGDEEISNFFAHIEQDATVNNNFKPKCKIDNSKWFSVSSQIKDVEDKQRLFCKVKTIGSATSKDFPDIFQLVITDNTGNEMERFSYTSSPGFVVDYAKTKISLSSAHPSQSINIKTREPIHVRGSLGSKEWITSSFNQKQRIQTIKIDMRNEKENKSWELFLNNGQQAETIEVMYKHSGQKESHSFISLSLDWPQYLIILMAIVFGILCFIQYYSEEKKNKYS